MRVFLFGFFSLCAFFNILILQKNKYEWMDLDQSLLPIDNNTTIKVFITFLPLLILTLFVITEKDKVKKYCFLSLVSLLVLFWAIKFVF